jgi:hypothetical protein
MGVNILENEIVFHWMWFEGSGNTSEEEETEKAPAGTDA